MLVVLPPRPRRAWARAFALATGLWAGLAAAVLASLAAPGSVIAALLVASVACVVAAWRPRVATLAYRVWNKGARMYARAAAHVAVVLCYAVVTAAGAAGSSLRLQRPRPGESLWQPRPTLPLEAYGSQSARPGRAWHGHPWADLVRWAVGTPNAWAIFLVPFLVLIVALESQEQDEAFPAGIYTLF